MKLTEIENEQRGCSLLSHNSAGARGQGWEAQWLPGGGDLTPPVALLCSVWPRDPIWRHTGSGYRGRRAGESRGGGETRIVRAPGRGFTAVYFSLNSDQWDDSWPPRAARKLGKVVFIPGSHVAIKEGTTTHTCKCLQWTPGVFVGLATSIAISRTWIQNHLSPKPCS